MKNNYWTDKHENLCLRWFSATTQQEYSQIYKELVPAMNHMAELIMNRYFSVPLSKQLQYKKDAVQEAFVKLKEFDTSKVKNNNGAYSWCSLIIKRFYYDIELKKGYASHVKLEYTDNLNELDSNYTHDFNFDYNQEKENTRLMISYIESKKREFEKIRDNLETQLKTKRRTAFNQLKKYKSLLKVCDLCIEFITRFETITFAQMADYCRLNNEKESISLITIRVYFIEMFGYNVPFTLRQEGNKNVIRKLEEKDKEFSPLDDDTPPNWITKQSDRRNKLRKKTENVDYFPFM